MGESGGRHRSTVWYTTELKLLAKTLELFQQKKPKEHGCVPSAFDFQHGAGLQHKAGSLATAVAATSATTSAAAVSTSASAAAATTATAATAATVSATTSASATLFAGTGFVDSQRTPVVILLVQTTDRLVGGIIIRHFDETETLAPTGVPVLNDLSTLH